MNTTTPQADSTPLGYSENSINIRALQAPLRAKYQQQPTTAIITDRASSCSRRIPASQPLYGMVQFHDPAGSQLPIALHRGVGGLSDLPVPGDVFCAALASCLDTTIRVIANFMGIDFKELRVEVAADADLRGTLRMDTKAPVGFKEISVVTTMIPEGELEESMLEAILSAAEASCVILQTLRNPPQINITRRKSGISG